MGAQGPGSRDQPLSEINVTPFVDVMLVLLIIFMVTAPLMLQGMDVNLPETSTQPIRMPDAPLVLTVTKEGEYSLARKVIPADKLEAKLLAVFESRGSKEVFLRADEAAPYGVVVQAMAAARRAGASRLGIVTEEEH